MKKSTISPSIILATSEIWSTLSPKIGETMTKATEIAANTTLIPNKTMSGDLCINCLSVQVILFYSILFSVIIVLGVLGNAFVVGVIVSDRKLLNSSVNLFLLNLALADMGNLIFCSPDALFFLLDRGWQLPAFLCPITRFLQESYLYASVLLQMSIGVERYMAICSPLRITRFTRKTTAYFIISVWAVAAAFAFPYFLYQTTSNHYSKRFEFCSWAHDVLKHSLMKVFRYSEFAVLYGVPLVLLTVLYYIMGRVLWGGRSTSIANQHQQVAILKLRRSVVKMLMISMLIYFICYSPIQVMFFGEFVLHHRINIPSWARTFLNVLPMASSSANPIVYIMCCRHFHSRFMSLLDCCFFCCGGWMGRQYKRQSYLGGQIDKTVASRTNSRSPYVSFRRSLRNPQSITLL